MGVWIFVMVICCLLLVHVLGADFGERSSPPSGGHGTAKRSRFLSGRSWRTTKPRPAICTVLAVVILLILSYFQL
jgi:hypothetical protein